MTARIASNVIERHSQVPFHSLVNVEDDEEELEKDIGHAAPKIKGMVDRLVGNLRKHRRYADDHPEYKHEKLTTLSEDEQCFTTSGDTIKQNDRSSSLDEISDLCPSSDDPMDAVCPTSAAFRGRRRSRSDSDLIASEIFARRRAAICEEMERNIFMENGATLRKCRKNLVLNQILENLSLL